MNLLCVLLGGFIGGSLRYGFTRLLPAPYCTFVANILGSLALGLAYGFTQLADVPLIHPFLALEPGARSRTFSS